MKISAERGYRHYFYGSTKETLGKMRKRLLKEHPGLLIVGMYSPPFGPMTKEEDEALVKDMNATKPDFVWVALGAPKQENGWRLTRGVWTG